MTRTQVLGEMEVSAPGREQTRPRKKSARGLGARCGVVALSALYMGVGAFSLVSDSVQQVIQRKKKKREEEKALSARPAKPSGKKPLGSFKIPMLPIDNYRHLDENDILRQLPGLSRAELTIVQEYEVEHDHRQVVLNTINTLLGS